MVDSPMFFSAKKQSVRNFPRIMQWEFGPRTKRCWTKLCCFISLLVFVSSNVSEIVHFAVLVT